MDYLREKLSFIKNKEHLRLLKRISIYYKYGKEQGDRLLSKDIESSVNYDDIKNFLEEYQESNSVLLDYFIENGLPLNDRMLEFCPSSFFTFQSTNLVPNITSIIKYQTPYVQYSNEVIGMITKSGVHIQSDFDFELENYTTILNNSIIDLLKNYNNEENAITDVHGIKFAEDNNLDYYSGFAIRNNSPLKDYIKSDFMKSIDKIETGHEACVFEELKEYTLGYVKRLKVPIIWPDEVEEKYLKLTGGLKDEKRK